jgi:hypothetical protein
MASGRFVSVPLQNVSKWDTFNRVPIRTAYAAADNPIFFNSRPGFTLG